MKGISRERTESIRAAYPPTEAEGIGKNNAALALELALGKPARRGNLVLPTLEHRQMEMQHVRGD
jgi:hypothetical protein